jgi:glycosyltransferase involved in cell wall biosynthesis
VLEAVQETVVILVGPDEDVHPGAISEGKALSDELGISHAVRFLGARTGQQKLDCLGAADLFVLPSYNENFPISILEAMASGLPVISTNVGGIPEILSDAFPEDLIESGDSVALAERIKAYVSNPKLSQESGRRNQTTAEQRFNLDVFAKCLEDAYDAACNR